MEEGDQKNKIIEVTEDLLRRVGFDGEVKLTKSETQSGKLEIVSIESTNDLSMLIGKNGQNLNAFEHLVRLMVSKKLPVSGNNEVGFIIDVNDYRKSRANYLISAAKNVAQRVIQTQKAEALLPMSAYERRLVHMELASYKEVQTESVGQEPRRRIVVKPSLAP